VRELRRAYSRDHTILTSRELTSCQKCGTEIQPETVDKVVLASCCLRNRLCKERKPPDETELLCPRTSGLRNLQLTRNAPREAKDVRDYFRDYFNLSVRSVPWQLAAVRRGRLHSP